MRLFPQWRRIGCRARRRESVVAGTRPPVDRFDIDHDRHQTNATGWATQMKATSLFAPFVLVVLALFGATERERLYVQHRLRVRQPMRAARRLACWRLRHRSDRRQSIDGAPGGSDPGCLERADVRSPPQDSTRGVRDLDSVRRPIRRRAGRSDAASTWTAGRDRVAKKVWVPCRVYVSAQQ